MIAPMWCFGTKGQLCRRPLRFVTSKSTGACGLHIAGLLAWHLETAMAASSVEVYSLESWYDLEED